MSGKDIYLLFFFIFLKDILDEHFFLFRYNFAVMFHFHDLYRLDLYLDFFNFFNALFLVTLNPNAILWSLRRLVRRVSARIRLYWFVQVFVYNFRDLVFHGWHGKSKLFLLQLHLFLFLPKLLLLLLFVGLHLELTWVLHLREIPSIDELVIIHHALVLISHPFLSPLLLEHDGFLILSDFTLHLFHMCFIIIL